MRNGSFGQPNVNGQFQYNPGVADNYFGGNSGVAADGSAWSFPNAPDGNGQVGFLQDTRDANGNPSTIVMNVYGLTPGARYVVRFQMSQRLYFPANNMHVAIDNQSVGYYSPSALAWQQVVTAAFTASATTVPLSFSGLTGGSSGTGIDAVQVVPAGGSNGTVANASFESPGVGSHAYRPSTTGVTFNNDAGISANGGAFGFPATSDGNQAAFVQASNSNTPGSIVQEVTGLTAGSTYRVVFKAVNRPNFAQGRVRVGTPAGSLGDFNAPGSWTSLTSATFIASGSSTTVTFQGLSQGGDTATAIDAVQVVRQ